jgi:hypothetical protein
MSTKNAYTCDIQSYDKSITGFKVTKAEGPPKQEGRPFKRAEYVSLTTNEEPRGWRTQSNGKYVQLGHFQDTMTAVEAIKRELPNTRKRLQR